MNNPKVGIILINYNNYEDTIECLNSINNSYYKNKIVIIVDNKSKNNSVEKIIEFIKKIEIKVELIKNDENLGFSAANNIGIKYCLQMNCKYLLLLNNDTIVDKQFINPLVDFYEKNYYKDIAGLTGKIYFFDNPNTFWWAGGNNYVGSKRGRGKGKKDYGQFDRITRIKVVNGCFLFTSKNIVEKNGLLDESFFFGEEDVEFCYRLNKSGYKFYFIPHSKIWHKVGKTRSFSPPHLFNGYASMIIRDKKIFNKKIFNIYFIIKSIYFLLSSYIRYKRKKGIKISYKSYLELLVFSLKFGLINDKITEEDLINIDVLFKQKNNQLIIFKF